ncbi:flagellar hook-length control protein FliK [Bacillus marinisedimentorum]|uniref:flagellar hook-length control protein FliK n=1 Tax=Bacillus marinisedimentorum TaxID=1821260 RepID=UPI0007E20DE2|nr:flagellar hook-length control protein FliK [Bacillus marinisedimentorum]
MKINTMMPTSVQKPAVQSKSAEKAAIFQGLISSLKTDGNPAEMKKAGADPLIALIEMITGSTGTGINPANLQPEMLQSVEAAGMLAHLPEGARAEIEQLFKSGIQADELIQRLKATGDPALMIAAVIYSAMNSAPKAGPINSMEAGKYNPRQMLKNFGNHSGGLAEKSAGGQVSKEQAVKLLELAASTVKNRNATLAQPVTGRPEQMPGRFSLHHHFSAEAIKEYPETIKALTGTHQIQTHGNGLHALQQYSIHLGESGQTEAAKQQFTREFQQILSRAAVKHDGAGTTRLSIRLFPENLGSVTVELVNEKGMLTARIAAATAGAKELLESQLHQLRQLLVNQNIPLEKLEVSTQQQAFRSMLDQGGQREQEENAQPFVHDREQDGGEDEEELETFQEMLMNLKI